MRVLIALLLCPLAWGAAYTSKATACSPGPCNWSAAGSWTEGAVPGNGDTVSIANTHSVTVDVDVTVGTSVNAYYSYISSMSVQTGGSGGSGTCTATVSGGTNHGYGQQANCTLSSGAVSTVSLTVPRHWYATASAVPTCSFSATGLTGSACALVFHQGSGVAAIHLNASGKLTIGDGRTLRTRGTIVYTSGSDNTATAITFGSGARLIFDSSQAAALADGTKPIYSYGPSGSAALGIRPFVADCTPPASRCSISSDSGGNIASICNHSFVNSGPLTLKYVDISRMGNPHTGWMQSDMPAANTTANALVDHCNITGSGPVVLFHASGAASFTFTANTLTGSIGRAAIEATFGAPTTGSFTLARNVFDLPLFTCDPTGSGLRAANGVTIEDNYFADRTCFYNTAANPWASFARNFYRTLVVHPSNNQGAYGDLTDNYFFLDAVGDNWHVIGITRNGPVAVSGNIAGVGDTTATDSGEFVVGISDPPTVTTHQVRTNIILPAATGYSWGELVDASYNGGHPNVRLEVDHNTWFGGWASEGGNGFPMVQENESQSGATPRDLPGTYTSIRSNIIWNPEFAGYTNHRPFFVTRTIPDRTDLPTDVNVPSGSDYNWKWNHTNVWSGCVNCANQGNGYAARYSVTPGVNDGTGDPLFVDWQRSVELFDSRYLGNHFDPWVSNQAYSLGDFVSATDLTLTWGLAVNFRCRQATCQGTNKPGVPGTAWRSDGWEWASLYRLRTATAAGETYALTGALAAAAPSTCNVAVATPICRMMAWVRAGYAPTAPLAAASYPGDTAQYVGAVPWIAASGGTPMFPWIWATAKWFRETPGR